MRIVFENISPAIKQEWGPHKRHEWLIFSQLRDQRYPFFNAREEVDYERWERKGLSGSSGPADEANAISIAQRMLTRNQLSQPQLLDNGNFVPGQFYHPLA